MVQNGSSSSRVLLKFPKILIFPCDWLYYCTIKLVFHYIISLNLKRSHTCSLLLISGVMVLRAPAIGTFSALAKSITFSLDEADDSPETPNSLMKSPLGHYVDNHGSWGEVTWSMSFFQFVVNMSSGVKIHQFLVMEWIQWMNHLFPKHRKK